MRANEAFSTAAEQASRQHGIVTWQHLRDAGLSRAGVSRAVERGQLVRVAPATYRFAGSPDTWLQQVAIAAFSTCGWVSHRTAARLHRLDGHNGRIVEVSVPRGSGHATLDGVKVHESKDLKGVDFAVVDGIPCTSLVRTLIDLPAVEREPFPSQALDDAWRRNPAVLASVRQRFKEVAKRGRNGTTGMRALLAERPGGTIPPDSVFEAITLRLIADTILPTPQRQYEVRDGNFLAFLDIAWPAIRFGLECDSLAHHSGKRAHEWDRERRRRLKALGWDIVEYTYDDVTGRPDHVASELVRLYQLRLASLGLPPLLSTPEWLDAP